MPSALKSQRRVISIKTMSSCVYYNTKHEVPANQSMILPQEFVPRKGQLAMRVAARNQLDPVVET
eukprot:6187500-Pleurochrysis_carterae.AAC.1